MGMVGERKVSDWIGCSVGLPTSGVNVVRAAAAPLAVIILRFADERWADADAEGGGGGGGRERDSDGALRCEQRAARGMHGGGGGGAGGSERDWPKRRRTAEQKEKETNREQTEQTE